MSRHRFDQSKADQVLVAVRAGATDEVASVHAGVPVEAVRDWLKGGTVGTDKFRAAVDKARADLSLLAAGTIRRGIAEDRQAAIYFAERLATDVELQRLRELTTD